LYARNIALTTAQWETLVNASFQVFAALLLASLLRFINVWKLSYRPWFLALLIAAPLTLVAVPAQNFLQVTAFWHLTTVVATAFTLMLTLKAALVGNREARLLVATLALIVLLALHDWALHSAHLWKQYVGSVLGSDITLLQYSAPLLFMVIGWIMTSRYLRTLDAFERLNSELDQRVKDKEAALEASYARMRRLEMEQAVATERERIHSDLHDDVGAKLLSLVYRAETSENAELARSALQDLRDVVSQTSESTGLEALAADWRAECDKRLSEAQIRLNWHETGNLAGVQLTQPQVLNLTRILRESISNIIRHSGARVVTTHISCTRDHFRLDISDNGKGCSPTQTNGRGLRNMAVRANKLNGSLAHFTPPGGGHGIRVTMPLNKVT
jgi:signal transduction histidine kinase